MDRRSRNIVIKDLLISTLKGMQKMPHPLEASKNHVSHLKQNLS